MRQIHTVASREPRVLGLKSHPKNTVIYTDCKSVLQTINSNGENETLRELKTDLNNLQQKTNLWLQWIPFHCGLQGTENADKLSKAGLGG